MQPVQHHTTTHTIGPGPDSPEGCEQLPVSRLHVYGEPSWVSFWKPSAEELRLLNAGRPVLIAIAGSNQPPLTVLVDSPEMHSPLRAELEATMQKLLASAEAHVPSVARPDDAARLRERIAALRDTAVWASDADLEEAIRKLSAYLSLVL